MSMNQASNTAKPISNDTHLWTKHGYSHWQRNFHDRDLRETGPDEQLEMLLKQIRLEGVENGKVLDIGCGGGKNLHWLVSEFGMSEGHGTEIHPDIVKDLAEAFPEYHFKLSDTTVLPYDTDAFDIVLLKGVLVLLDRNDVLQAVGESIRVCSKYLIHADYTPLSPYSTENTHVDRQRVYKMDYGSVLESTGLLRFVGGSVINDGDEWNRIVMRVYRKVDPSQTYPLKTREDFG